MSITEKVQKDMIAAMKARDKERVSALRMILSQLQMGEKEARGEFGEAEEFKVLATEKKRRLQAAEAFRDGGRAESALKEEAEAEIIDTYLPRAMTDDELTTLVDDAIAAVGAQGPRDTGKVMSHVMAKAAGKADGRTVSAIVKNRLGA
ncbi:MAG: GatB/YqeY domain-containing protein [Thermoleophilia bacterium]|jgi:hypothetical protein